jgi:hypothetical protein
MFEEMREKRLNVIMHRMVESQMRRKGILME